MIVEIAIGVCLGIVAAYFIIKQWRVVIGCAGAFLVYGALLGGLAFGGYYLWHHPQAIGFVVAILAVGLVYALPKFTLDRLATKYPKLKSFFEGGPEWRGKRQLLRVALFVPIAIVVAGLVLLILSGVLWVIGAVFNLK